MRSGKYVSRNVSVVLMLLLAAAGWCIQDSASAGKVSSTTAPSAKACFIGNSGQFDEQVKFYVQRGSSRIFLTAKDIVFDFVKKNSHPDPVETAEADAERLVFRAKYGTTNRSPLITGRKKLPGSVSYMVGNRENWKSNISTFEEIEYQGLFDGIGLVFRLPGNNLSYDVVLTQDSALRNFALTYEGVERVSINDSGELVLRTPFGDFVEKPPRVFRAAGSKRELLNVHFKLIDDLSVGLELAGAGEH